MLLVSHAARIEQPLPLDRRVTPAGLVQHLVLDVGPRPAKVDRQPDRGAGSLAILRRGQSPLGGLLGQWAPSASAPPPPAPRDVQAGEQRSPSFLRVPTLRVAWIGLLNELAAEIRSREA